MSANHSYLGRQLHHNRTRREQRTSTASWITGAALVLVLLFAAEGCAQQSQVVVYKAGETHYFRHAYGTGSEYVALLPDGRYRYIQREHLFVEESDHGTWKVSPQGEISLTSEMEYRTLESGPFEVRRINKNNLDRLTSLSRALKHLIEQTTETTLASREFQDRLHRLERWLPLVEVNDSVSTVSMNEIRKWLADIDRVSTSTLSPSVVRVVPRKLGAAVFLEIKPHRQMHWFRIELDRCEQSVREAGERPPDFVFAEIDHATFTRESASTQEFIYHKELNKPRRGSNPNQ